MTSSPASSSSEELLLIARNAVISGHRATAARMVNRVLENDPHNKDAWRLLAECLPDPEAKRKCLVKAGDLPNHSEKATMTTDRYTIAPAHRVEMPPEPGEEQAEPVILEPRKYKTKPRAEYPEQMPEKRVPPRTARTRKTDPQPKHHARKSGGCSVFLLLVILIAGLAAAYWYFKPDLPIDQVTALLFPSTQATENDASVDGLVPPEQSPTPEVTETPAPDANQPEENPPAEVSQPAALVEKIIPVGTSVSGRPLEVFQFGEGSIQRLVVAGMHGGNEYNTVSLADQLIVYIHAHPEIIPADTTLFVLRNLNPDGEARSHGVDGRVNENGVDLNRNWDSHWKIDWNRDNCWSYRPVTGGPFPASEPETKALQAFINDHAITGIINYHSAALGIFPGGQPFEAKSSQLAEELHAVTTYSYPPVDIGCEYTGMFTDWAADHGIPAVDVELTNHSDTDFDQNLEAVKVLLAFEPSATPKSLPEGATAGENEDEGVFDQIKQSADDIYSEVYGMIMSNFEER